MFLYLGGTVCMSITKFLQVSGTVKLLAIDSNENKNEPIIRPQENF